MSAMVDSYGYETDASYAADFGRDRELIKSKSRRPEYRRKGSAPTRVSGMHCRRNKRWSWGSGRAARMSNLRAFAGCLAVGVALAAGVSHAVPLTPVFVPVGDSGNAGKVVGTGTYGAVASEFLMSQFETTNAQYVQFLNAVGASNTNNVFPSVSGAEQNFGITRSGAAGSYTYAVRSGNNPAGVPYADAPVNFTTWFSAARYVNWLAAGQPSGSSGVLAMEGGFAGSAYNLGGRTSGQIVSRNANATYWIPSLNESFKAAFYNGTDYNLWPTTSGTITPSVATNPIAATGTNVATYGGSAAGVTGPLAVDAFTNSQSPYSLYGMLGNISEMTDTANSSGNWAAMSGSWGTLTSNLANFSSTFGSTAAPRFVSSTSSTAEIGFRVAQVAPVPEPETITLAAFGVVGLCGANWLKRRRRAAAAAEALAT